MLIKELYTQPGLVAFMGDEMDTQFHSHQALQLVLALDKPFSITLECEGGRLTKESKFSLIGSNQSHCFSGTNCIFFLLEPESHVSKALKNKYLHESGMALFPDTDANPCSVFLANGLNQLAVEAAIKQLVPQLCFERHIDKRIELSLTLIDEAFEQGGLSDISLKAVLSKINLSESRFLHLFSEQLGLPWRRYLLWRRLLFGAQSALSGNSLTDAALSAGFSDAAHFNRTFKGMFGLTPYIALK